MPPNRYDIIYGTIECTIEPHFCREWDNGEGCYGYNPHHGYSWEEAKQIVIQFYQQKITEWEGATEKDYLNIRYY